MTAILTASPIRPAGAATRPRGSASGGVRAILRLEGAAAFAAAIALYVHAGFSWPLFALLFLAPDLAMLAYLIGAAGGRRCLQSRPHLCAGAAARACGLCSPADRAVLRSR